MSERAVRRMTEAEFLESQLHQELQCELVGGLPRAMTGARFRHDVVPLPVLGIPLSLPRLYRSVELRPRPRPVADG